MERIVNLFMAFIVGIVFMLLPLNNHIFEGFTSNILSLLHVIGFLIVLLFGFALIYSGFKNFKD